jgi:glycosyltransferase involved in cell wall biosynthesis
MSKIKVLRIINRFNLGGITYNVSYLSKYLPEEYETLLIGGPEEKGEESSLYIPQSLGLKPLIINELRRSINPFQDYLAYKKIKKIIREFHPDIVHTHASKAGAIGRLAAAHCKVKVVVHTFHGHVFHGYFPPFKTNIFKQIERYLSKKSAAIIAISQIQKNELCKVHRVCAEEKTHVINLGFDLNRFTENIYEKRNSFRNKYQLDNETLAIGIIGRLAPIKNHFLFIDAIEHVLRNCSQTIKAFIIGDGETKQQLIDYINFKNLTFTTSECNTDAVFIFTSWIKQVDTALPGLDIVALTSKNEGTPVSLIEAQAAGKFVVTTNVGGIADILHENSGFLSENGDDNQFKINLLKSIIDFETLNKQAQIAGVEILNKFNYQRLCDDINVLYKGLLFYNKLY